MVVMGHVVGPFGVLGWLKIQPYTEYIDSLLDYSSWWFGKENGEWQEIEIVSGRINGNTLNVKPEKCNDRTQALQMKGMQIAIPRDQLPDLPENGMNGYYWSDLIGSDVFNLKDENLGKVIGLFETGANDVLRVQHADQDKPETLIPFIEQVIIKTDLKLSRIIVDWGTDY